MKKTILNLLQENGALPVIIQRQIIMPQMKLPLKLKSSLYDCNDLYILVKGDIAVIEYQAT